MPINQSAIPEEGRKRIMDEYKRQGEGEGSVRRVLTGGLYEAAYGTTTGRPQGILDEQGLIQAPQDAFHYLYDYLKKCGQLEPIIISQELRWMGKADGMLPAPFPYKALRRLPKVSLKLMQLLL